MRITVLALWLTGMATLAVTPASAHPFQRVLYACTPDYHELCRDVPPGQGRILACLVKNRDKLSPTCKSALGEIQKNLNMFISEPVEKE